MQPPWEHPDWYDLHDTAWTAGSEREPEHYREPRPLPASSRGDDHLVDVGAGTGKLAGLVVAAYPEIGRVTMLEPNAPKLARAVARLGKVLPSARVHSRPVGLGPDTPSAAAALDVPATIVTIGSVFMPIMELRGGTLADGLTWLHASLRQIRTMLAPAGWMYDVETLAAPWASGGASDPVRRLRLPELGSEMERAGFGSLECVYRFRDRVVVKAQPA
ncbi:MAG: hypothetical protein U0166_22455 [Acidobacteriota bacterium]